MPPNFVSKAWAFVGVAILLCTCTKNPAPAEEPRAVEGRIDLTEWDISTNPSLPLNGEWHFYWNQLLSLQAIEHNHAASKMILVPGSWNIHTGQQRGIATYHLHIDLPKDYHDLWLAIPEFSTAAEVEVNGQVIFQSGEIGRDIGSSVPSYHSGHYDLPPGLQQLDLVVRVSNFHFNLGGILHPFRMAPSQVLVQEKAEAIWSGSLLVGVLLFLTVFHVLLFIFLPQHRYNLLYGLMCLSLAVHYLGITDRWLFDLMGPAYWTIAHKAQYVTIFVFAICSIQYVNAFYEHQLSKRLERGMVVVLAVVSVVVILLSDYWASYATYAMRTLIPILVIIVCYILIKAYRKKVDGVKPMFIANLLAGLFVLFNNFEAPEHVRMLNPLHFSIVFILLAFAFLTSRRFARALMQNLKLNAQLEAHNANLETTVKEKVAQLVTSEKRNLELELDAKEKDLEYLRSTELMKMKISANMKDELQRIMAEEQDLEKALQKLMHQLDQQTSAEERLEMLQTDPTTLNESFYNRLHEQFPSLSKTEAELCAYIRLNLSSKEIANLMQTSMNSINVTRSRLRKKLHLNREDDLNQFIHQL